MARAPQTKSVEETQRGEIRRLRAEVRRLQTLLTGTVQLLQRSVAQGALLIQEHQNLRGEYEAAIRADMDADSARETKTDKVREGVRRVADFLRDTQNDEKTASFFIDYLAQLDERLWKIDPKPLLKNVRDARKDRRFTAATVFAELCEVTGAFDFTEGKALASIKAMMRLPKRKKKRLPARA